MKINTPTYFRLLAFLTEKLLRFKFSNRLFKSLSNKKIFFIQIGANDGVSQDPIFSFNSKWDGILVEPIPFVFEQLKSNYGKRNNGNLYFENIAVGKEDGMVDFFLPADYASNLWKTKVASLDNSIGMMSGMETVALQVPCLSLDSLIKKYNLKNIDLLVIDIEGKEIDIFNSYSFEVKPSVIYFETRFLDFDTATKLYSKFINLGYRVFREYDNTLLILK